MLSGYERIPWNDRDFTFNRGNRCMYSISVNEGLMLFVEGFKVIDWDEKVSTDYREHVIDLHLENF